MSSEAKHHGTAASSGNVRRVPNLTRRNTTPLVALSVYLVLLLAVLLVPDGGVPSSSVGWVAGVAEAIGTPQWLLDPARFEFLCNVLILVPATFLGSMVWGAPTWTMWTAAGLTFSTAIELVQAVFEPNRSGSSIDVAANTLGALIGALAVLCGRRVVRRRSAAKPAEAVRGRR
jgi:membrane associated rhomboid family serine protease